MPLEKVYKKATINGDGEVDEIPTQKGQNNRGTDLPWTSRFSCAHFPTGCSETEWKIPNVVLTEKNLHKGVLTLNWVRPQTESMNLTYAKSQLNVAMNKVMGLCITGMKLDTGIPTSPWKQICALSMSNVRLFACLLLWF